MEPLTTEGFIWRLMSDVIETHLRRQKFAQQTANHHTVMPDQYLCINKVQVSTEAWQICADALPGNSAKCIQSSLPFVK